MAPIEWRISDALIDYDDAVAFMEGRVHDIRRAQASEMIWLLEHPPLYTAGTSAKPEDLVDAGALPVYKTGRGGQVTYHGPGQRVGYVMLDLTRRGNDIRQFVRDLEEWLIQTLARFNLKGERREGRIGIWIVESDGSERKIAALGVRVRHGVTFHGVALNVEPNLAHFSGIIPCGIREHGVTSLAAQGILVSMPEVDLALKRSFYTVFGAESSDQPQKDS